MAKKLVLGDTAYVARVERHNAMFRLLQSGPGLLLYSTSSLPAEQPRGRAHYRWRWSSPT